MNTRAARAGAVTVAVTVLLTTVMLLPASAALVAKIGYVDVQAVFDDYLKKTDLEAQLQAEFDSRREELRVLRSELEEMRAELSAQRSVLTASASQEREEEIEEKERYISHLEGAINEDLQRRQDAYSQELLDDIMGEIEAIAEAEGYRFVFDSVSLLYASPEEEFDLTRRILTRLNDAYRSSKE